MSLNYVQTIQINKFINDFIILLSAVNILIYGCETSLTQKSLKLLVW